MKNEIINGQNVKFFLGNFKKTAVSGVVVKNDYRFVYVRPVRVAGKFAKVNQKNVLGLLRSELV